MNVLSCFDGISCGKVALDRAGIKIDNYFASEIDKYAIKISKKNHPSIIHLGDVLGINLDTLPKIDLLMGGSPCQGFSFAGKRLNFKDSRSKLFFNFVDILSKIKPKYFLLENVKMKKEYQDIISNLIKVKPIEIDSSLMSAQGRKRLYWTNIPNIKQPKDKEIILKDILEDDCLNSDKSFYTATECISKQNYKTKELNQIKKSKEILATQLGNSYNFGNKVKKDKAYCLRASQPNGIIYPDNRYRKLTPVECERLQTLPDNYTYSISNTQRYKMLGNGWTVNIISHILKNIKG